jgi:isopenicillin N synthase-like dioxygenase
MAQTPFTSIPIIDINPFVNPHCEDRELKKREVATKLHEACKNVGFFYIKGHGVDQQLVDGVRTQAKEFFDLPEEKKNDVLMSKGGFFRGYQKLGENVTQYQRDWHEAIDLYCEIDDLKKDDPHYELKKFLNGPNLYPSYPPEFKKTLIDYIEAMKKLGDSVMRAIALGLGLEEDFFAKKYTNDSFWVMRVIGYPSLNSAKDKADVSFSCGEHCDYGCLTIVNQDPHVCALQVKNTQGQWIDAYPIPGAFVMNIGDMLKVWSNGLYQSTPHRVINNSDGRYRVSIPFFFEPNFDAVVEPLDVCCKEKGPQFQSVLYGKHLIGKVTSNFQFDM